MSRLHAIQVLNDNARTTFVGCALLMSRDFYELPNDFKDEALARVRAYRKFAPDGHHDAGLILIEGKAVRWRLDCRKPDLKTKSDPADESGLRVLIVEMV